MNDTPTAAEPTLSVIIPCYNERQTIAELLQRVHAAAPADKEVIVVDDASTDGTRELLEGELRGLCSRLILQPQNRGKGAALRAGFTAASGRFVVVQDADLEYDPAEYALLLKPLLDGRADVVFGSRFAGSGPHRVVYFWHMVGNRLLTLLSNMFTNINLTDMETCYKVFRRELIQSLELQENRFGFEPEVTVKIAKSGARIYEVGISYAGRSYAEGKKIGWKDGVSAMRCLAKYGWSERNSQPHFTR